MWLIKCILNLVEQVNSKLPDEQASHLFKKNDFHVDDKMLGHTEGVSTDSTVVGLDVHVVGQVHS